MRDRGRLREMEGGRERREGMGEREGERERELNGYGILVPRSSVLRVLSPGLMT